MKNLIKLFLHKIFGFENYLAVFSIFKIYTLQWDKREKDFFYFLKMIPDRGIILDIGANIGFIAVTLAKKKRNSLVHAFEPVPQNNRVLRKIISLFRLENVTVHDFALGNRNGEAEMVMPVIGKVKMQGLSHVIEEGNQNKDGVIFRAKMLRMDDVHELSENGQPVTAIKLDVENFEYAVLKGGEQLLKKFRPIIFIELWDNENRTQCIDFIKTVQYEVKVLHNNQLENYDRQKHANQQFFFIPSAQ